MPKFALVDVETTGGNPRVDRIIDIGIVLLEDYEAVEEWQCLINPGIAINPFITEITGITNQDVQHAPSFNQISKQVLDMLEDRIFVAHNARFDYLFLKHEFLRLERQFHAPQLCTVKLSRLLYPEFRHHNLDAIIDRLQLNIKDRHRALPDAKVMYSFIESSINSQGKQTVDQMIAKIIKRPALPAHISMSEIDSLPSTVGVYIFYDQEGAPLYVGKSVNIKDRVMSHFYEDIYSQKEMALKQRVAHIETKICAGELEALLLESKLVKELLPTANRKLRNFKRLWVGRIHTNANGFNELVLEPASSITYNDRNHIVAIAKTKRQLTANVIKLCEQHNLCPRLCGLEKGKGACFSYHLGTCRGACNHQESVNDYNVRLRQAFDGEAITDWPYPGPVVIHERNETTQQEAFHLIYNWLLVKTTKTYDDLESVQLSDGSICLDEYQILKNHLSKHQAIPLNNLLTVNLENA